MDSRAALGAATAVALTITGGVSALFLTVGQANAAGPASTDELQPAVMVEYVDQYGNPVAPPAMAATANGASPEVILLNADGTPAAPSAPAQPAPYAEHEEDEHEEYEEEEHEEEYEEAEHEEHGEAYEQFAGSEQAAGYGQAAGAYAND